MPFRARPFQENDYPRSLAVGHERLLSDEDCRHPFNIERAARGRKGVIPSTKDMADAPGMRGYRSRNDNGLLRDKRDDTHMGTIEKQYGRDFGVRSDMQLGTYLKQNNVKSLNDLLHGK